MEIGWLPEATLKSQLAKLAEVARQNPLPFVRDWQGTGFRFSSIDYADREKFTDGEGARRHGGRFTPIGGPRTLYLSLDRPTATAELDAWYEYYGVPDRAFRPRVLAAVAVSVRVLLDLTSPETLLELGLQDPHLAEEWRPTSDAGGVAMCQHFGAWAFEAGFEGLRFPSVRRDGGVNLALFPENYREDSFGVMLHA